MIENNSKDKREEVAANEAALKLLLVNGEIKELEARRRAVIGVGVFALFVGLTFNSYLRSPIEEFWWILGFLAAVLFFFIWENGKSIDKKISLKFDFEQLIKKYGWDFSYNENNYRVEFKPLRTSRQTDTP